MTVLIVSTKISSKIKHNVETLIIYTYFAKF